MLFKFLLLFALFGSSNALVEKTKGATWSYIGLEGPTFWPQKYRNCRDKYQSPIDIPTQKSVYDPDLPEPVFWHPPHADPHNHTGHYHVINNGHTVMMAFQEPSEGGFYVNGSGLDGMYKTAQLHFHWGSNNKVGSEHKINGKSYPLEMHIVNFDTKYTGALNAAKDSKTGLAVYGVMFELSENDDDNEFLIPFIDSLHKIHIPNKHRKEEVEVFVLRNLLPKDLSRYYRYQGSLTTPHCYESVVWTVFQQTLKLSKFQLMAFRGLLTHGHADYENSHTYNIPLVDNYRPVQPLNGRTVYRSFKDVPVVEIDTSLQKPSKSPAEYRNGNGNKASALRSFLPIEIIAVIVSLKILSYT